MNFDWPWLCAFVALNFVNLGAQISLNSRTYRWFLGVWLVLYITTTLFVDRFRPTK